MVGGGEGGHSHRRPSTGCRINSQFIAQRIQEGEQKLFVAKAEVQTPAKFSGRTQYFSGNSNHVSTVDRIEGFDWLDTARILVHVVPRKPVHSIAQENQTSYIIPNPVIYSVNLEIV